MTKSLLRQSIEWSWMGFKARWKSRWKSFKRWIDNKTQGIQNFYNTTKNWIGKTHNFVVGMLSPNYPIGRLYLFATVFVVLTIAQMPNMAIGAGIFYVCWLLERRK